MLIVEDGTGTNPAANTYVDLTDTDAYWEDRNLPEEWTCLNPEAQEAAILAAMTYLENKYEFKGCLVSTDQPLSWPRTEIQLKNGRVEGGEGTIPERVKEAVISLAYRHVIKDLFVESNPDSSRIKREKVVDHEIEFDTSKNSATNFGLVNMVLRPLLKSSPMNMRIVKG